MGLLGITLGRADYTSPGGGVATGAGVTGFALFVSDGCLTGPPVSAAYSAALLSAYFTTTGPPSFYACFLASSVYFLSTKSYLKSPTSSFFTLPSPVDSLYFTV